MNTLSFVLWLCLYPVCRELSVYIQCERRKLQNLNQFTKADVEIKSLMAFCFYIIVAIILFFNI